MAEFSEQDVNSGDIDMNVNPTNRPTFDITDPSTWDPDDPMLWMHKEWYYKSKGQKPPTDDPANAKITDLPTSEELPAQPRELIPTRKFRQLKAELLNLDKSEWQIRMLQRSDYPEEAERDWYAEIQGLITENDSNVNDDWILWHANFTRNFDRKMNDLVCGTHPPINEDVPRNEEPATPLANISRGELKKSKEKQLKPTKPLLEVFEDTSRCLNEAMDEMAKIESSCFGLNKKLSVYKKSAKTGKGKKFNHIELRKRNEVIQKLKLLRHKLDAVQWSLKRVESELPDA